VGELRNMKRHGRDIEGEAGLSPATGVIVTGQPQGGPRVNRFCLPAFLRGAIPLICVTQAAGQQACRPTLAFAEVQFSEMQPSTLERKWTAIVSVDASRCVASSAGSFELVFSRLKEIGPDLEFREQFAWRPPSVTVAVDFAADEAVERYWIANITPCPCAR
jgi:hypothetical protein